MYAEHGKCQKEAQVVQITQHFMHLALGAS
jgi:hypothetical protein